MYAPDTFSNFFPYGLTKSVIVQNLYKFQIQFATIRRTSRMIIRGFLFSQLLTFLLNLYRLVS